jgi:hypothetical protein
VGKSIPAAWAARHRDNNSAWDSDMGLNRHRNKPFEASEIRHKSTAGSTKETYVGDEDGPCASRPGKVIRPGCCPSRSFSAW